MATISPTKLGSGNVNDYAGIGVATFARLTPDATGSRLTGIVAPLVDATPLLLLNLGGGDLILVVESGLSAADNRFLGPEGIDVLLKPDGLINLIYDLASHRWRIIY